MKKTHLMMIDPQNDFCNKGDQKLYDVLKAARIPDNEMPPDVKPGALFVAGADQDMVRLAAFITRNQKRITNITCTLDSHDPIHIAHPAFWRNSQGQNPAPFTLITAQDVKNGVWSAFSPQLQARAQAYVDALATNKRYVLVIWPPHCLIGSWGAGVVPAVHAAMSAWATARFTRVNWVTKGSNYLTEHYSAVMADVPDPQDISTKLNTDFLGAFVDADEIIITGEALSHCVANTVTDLANNFGDDNIKKLVLLEDTTSNVTGFEKMGTDFVMAMVKRGMRLAKTTDY